MACFWAQDLREIICQEHGRSILDCPLPEPSPRVRLIDLVAGLARAETPPQAQAHE